MRLSDDLKSSCNCQTGAEKKADRQRILHIKKSAFHSPIDQRKEAPLLCRKYCIFVPENGRKRQFHNDAHGIV
jgi:hypothetical protein